MQDDLDRELENLKAYAHWLYGLSGSRKEPEGITFLHIVYVPRWKWFKPPMWKIFRWAYKVKEVRRYINVSPTNIPKDNPNDSKGEENNE